MSTAISYPAIPTSGNPFQIGNTAVNTTLYDYFNGLIDEVRIYNRALTAREIQQLYQIGARTVKFKQ